MQCSAVHATVMKDCSYVQYFIYLGIYISKFGEPGKDLGPIFILLYAYCIEVRTVQYVHDAENT